MASGSLTISTNLPPHNNSAVSNEARKATQRDESAARGPPEEATIGRVRKGMSAKQDWQQQQNKACIHKQRGNCNQLEAGKNEAQQLKQKIKYLEKKIRHTGDTNTLDRRG